MRVRGAGRAKPAPVFTLLSPVLLESTAQLEPTYTRSERITLTHSLKHSHRSIKQVVDMHTLINVGRRC